MICDGCYILFIFLFLGKAIEAFGEWAAHRKEMKEIEEYFKRKEMLKKIAEKYKIDEENEE